MTLFEIDKAIREFEFEIDEETGEILNAESLDELALARDQKIENIGLLYKEVKAESVAIKNEIDNLTVRLKRNNNKAESLLNYMKYALNGEGFKTARMVAQWKKSKKVEVFDEHLLPNEYVRTKTTTEPDKTAIKKAIEGDIEVPGARVVTNNNLSIR